MVSKMPVCTGRGPVPVLRGPEISRTARVARVGRCGEGTPAGTRGLRAGYLPLRRFCSPHTNVHDHR